MSEEQQEQPIKEHSDDAMTSTVEPRPVLACQYVGKQDGLVQIDSIPLRRQEILLAPADVVDHLLTRSDFILADDAAVAKAELKGMLFRHPYVREKK